MVKTVIETKQTIDLDLETAAKWFSGLSDDDMCRFLVLVAEEAKSWPCDPSTMWWHVGRHLRQCECSTERARDLIREIFRAMDQKE